MAASITFFPVGNGDMTLIVLDNGQRILVDIHVRAAANDDSDETPDVMAQLRKRLEADEQGRLYVDAFLLSHPDRDHIAGLEEHFHLGDPADWSGDEDKILINEMWSSPLVFRRANDADVADGDPKAWWEEARRRVRRFKEDGLATEAGDRILILGEDREGKTDGLEAILVTVGSTFSAVDRVDNSSVEVLLLGPIAAQDEAEDEEFSKNDSSVVARFTLGGGSEEDSFLFLTGGDAGVAIWERLWEGYGGTEALDYDMLQAPHHCSWRTLSHDSYSELGEGAEVSDDARSALAQAREGAIIVASSKAISPNDADPPSDRARREYVEILGDETRFVCVADHWDAEAQPLEYEINGNTVVLGSSVTAPEEFKSAGLAQSAAIIGISATEQTERALAAASQMRDEGRSSKPYAEDDA